MSGDLEICEKYILDSYLSSSDFNGVELENLSRSLRMDKAMLFPALKGLVKARRIDLISGQDVANPHIRHIGRPRDIEGQISFLENEGDRPVCVYPTSKLLKRFSRRFKDKPYTTAVQDRTGLSKESA